MGVTELDARLRALSSCISQAREQGKCDGKTEAQLLEEFRATARALSEEIEQQDVKRVKELVRDLHRLLFVSEYRLQALLNGNRKFAKLQLSSAEDAKAQASASKDESLVMFYRRAEQLHREAAAALSTQADKCEAMAPLQEG